jgi:hypothetical protein
LNFAELQTEVFRRLSESSSDPAFWTATDVKAALNEGYEEMSDASEWYEWNANLPLLSNRTYYDMRTCFGGDTVLTLKQAFNSTTRRWLNPVELRELDCGTNTQWEDVQGEPQSWFIRGLFWLGTFPKQESDSGTMKMYFTALPPALDSDYDEPGFPQDFQYGIVEYALGDLLSQEAETKKALSHFGEYLTYEAGLNSYTAGRISLDRINRLNG